MRQQNQFGVFWGCNICGGRAISIAVLRKAVRPDCVTRVWAVARDGEGTPGRLCPTCDHDMVEVPVSVDGQTLKLDVCKLCQFVWFDPNEYESVPPAPPVPRKPGEVDERDLPQAAREALALYKVQQIAEQARDEDASPDAEWKTVPALFGLPVEEDTAPLAHWPWLTWSVMAIIALVSIWAFSDLENIVAQFALIPAEAWRYGGLTSLTSFFLHGGWWHLIGNLYFLLIFGDNVEDYLGRWRWLLLILLATLAGDALHVLADPHSTVPCIGASGGISGVIAFYALKFPQARLGFLFRLYWRFQWVQIPAWGALVLWLLMQFFGAFLQLAGFSNVAATAHLGGAGAGFFAWLLWRKIEHGETGLASK